MEPGRSDPLDLFGYKIAFKAPGTDLEGNGSPLYLGLNFFQVRLPGSPGMILRVAHRITGNRVFSAYIAGSGHNKPSLSSYRIKTISKTKNKIKGPAGFSAILNMD
jgi:hypothetical protein